MWRRGRSPGLLRLVACHEEAHRVHRPGNLHEWSSGDDSDPVAGVLSSAIVTVSLDAHVGGRQMFGLLLCKACEAQPASWCWVFPSATRRRKCGRAILDDVMPGFSANRVYLTARISELRHSHDSIHSRCIRDVSISIHPLNATANTPSNRVSKRAPIGTATGAAKQRNTADVDKATSISKMLHRHPRWYSTASFLTYRT